MSFGDFLESRRSDARLRSDRGHERCKVETRLFFGKAQIKVEEMEKLAFHEVNLDEVVSLNSVGRPVNVLG